MTRLDRTVLITGASAGIGAACAERFAAAGARLLLAARRLDRLTSLADRLAAEHATESYLLTLDVRDVGVATRLLEDLPPRWRSIDILVNNAGLGRGSASIAEGDSRDWDEMIDTNLKGLLYVTRAVLPGMLERRRGHIVNIGSVAGREIYPNGVVYGATKAAVDAVSRGLRMDLIGSPIRVTNILPGTVQTEFNEVRFRGDQTPAAEVYRGLTPLRPEDVADAVLYAATRPAHVNVDELMLKPVAQANTTMTARTEAAE